MMSNAKQLLYPLLLSTAIATSAFAGGIGSGGGNTRPTETVSAGEVKWWAQSGVKSDMLIAYFNAVEGNMVYFPREEQELRRKLFGGPTLIQEVVRNTTVYIAETSPCFDHDGNPMDGSIVAPEPNAICISSFTIAKKLSKWEAFPQIVALIAHEYSHLLGATEREAEVLQATLYGILLGNRVDFYQAEKLSKEIGAAVYDFKLFSGLLSDLAENVHKLSAMELQKNILALYETSRSLSTFVGLPGQVVRPKVANLLKAYQIRMKTIAWNFCEQDIDQHDKLPCESRLQKVFENDSSITLTDYFARLSGGDRSVENPPGFSMRRILAPADLRAELLQLATETQSIAEAIIAEFNLPNY